MKANDHQAGNILIADDDSRFRELCEDVAKSLGLESRLAADGIEALELVKAHRFSLALIDLKMPKLGGIDLLYHTREIAPYVPVIIVTGYGSIESAVQSMKLGAVDYITKPCTVKEIRETILKILNEWKTSWRQPLSADSTGKYGIIGRARAMQIVYERIEATRNSDSTVLVMGESGVGKELVAKAIHYCGERAREPFIPIDCSVLSLNIVESELFGHRKGSFTDANYDKIGLLKLAGKGSVFFDEITEIPLQVQAKLLRAIQEREIRPLGASHTEKIKARIIAATNRNLERAVLEGRFREDLFYRLHVIPITVPLLRERTEDIPLLAEHFIGKYNTERKFVHGMTPEALHILEYHNWSGNVRELENVIQQAIVLGSGEMIRPIDLPPHIIHFRSVVGRSSSSFKTLDEVEREAILEALKITAGKKQEAARLLGIGKTTLYEKIKRYNLDESF